MPAHSSPVKFALLQFYELFNGVNIADRGKVATCGGARRSRLFGQDDGLNLMIIAVGLWKARILRCRELADIRINLLIQKA